MAYTSKDFNRDIDKAVKSGITEGVPTAVMFMKLALSGQEMGNYHIQQERQKLLDKQEPEIDLGKLNGLKKN